MRHSSRFIKRVSLTPLAVVALCCSILCLTSSRAEAQSGRRTQKSPQSPHVNNPPPEAQPTPKPPVVKADKQEIALYVSMTEHDPFLNIPLYLDDSVMDAFRQRLGQASSIKVTSGKEMHRSEAVKYAKGQTSAHVVLLQLDVDTFDSRRTSSGDVDRNRIVIRYCVFAPATGKTVLEGRVYQQDYRTGRVGVGIPSTRGTGALYSDYRLKEAAREAANRVLAEFGSYQRPREPVGNF